MIPGNDQAVGSTAQSQPEEYLVQRGVERFGPYPRDAFLQYARAGNFAAGDLVWRPGMVMWEPLEVVLARIEGRPVATGQASNEGLKYIVPLGASGWAVAATWVGIFSLFLLLPGPIAVLLGILALRDVKKHPTKSGVGRAWFGIVCGALATAFLVFIIARF